MPHATALLDVQHRTWCDELLRAVDLPIDRLPPLQSSTAVAGYLTREMADAMGLPVGLPVMCGAGDQEAQAIGNGIIRSGLLSSTIGTGGQLFASIDHYRSDPQLRIHTFCHALPDVWHWEAATLTAGASLRWLRDEVLGGRYTYQELADAAQTITAGAEGLYFRPYLAGERTPHMDPNLRGSFSGLTLRHTWKHMARAVMEGVVFSLADGLELMRDLGAQCRSGHRVRRWNETSLVAATASGCVRRARADDADAGSGGVRRGADRRGGCGGV